jgi:hypothetical protein
MKRINILLILWASIAAKASADRFSATDTLHRRSTYHEDAPESDDYPDSPDEPETDDNDISNYDSQDIIFAGISESELEDNSSQDVVEDYNNNYNREPDAL